MSLIVDQLTYLLNSKSPVDAKQIDTFITNELGTVLAQDDKFLPTLLPLIKDTFESPDYFKIDPERSLVTLLGSILKVLPLKEVLNYYPLPFILQALDSPLAALSQLAVQVLRQCDPLPEELLIEHPDIVSKILFRFFTKDEDSDGQEYGVVSSIEGLLPNLVLGEQVVRTQFLNDSNLSLWRSIKLDNDPILVPRLLSLILLLLPKYIDLVPVELYTWPLEFFADDDDVLSVVVILHFYTDLAKSIDFNRFDSQLPLQLLQTFQDLVKLYTLRTTNDNVASFYSFELVQYICSIANSVLVSQATASAQKMVVTFQALEFFQSFNLYIDSTESSDYVLLSSINANFIYLISEDFFSNFFADSMDDIFHKQVFEITLNLFRAEEFFDQIKPHLKPEIVKRLPSLDLSYRLIQALCAYSHTTTFLLHMLPSIVVGYLINTPSDISDKNIWDTRMLSLEALLFLFPPRELDGWEKELKESYALMKNGRNIKSISPSVDIAHETL